MKPLSQCEGELVGVILGPMGYEYVDPSFFVKMLKKEGLYKEVSSSVQAMENFGFRPVVEMSIYEEIDTLSFQFTLGIMKETIQ